MLWNIDLTLRRRREGHPGGLRRGVRDNHRPAAGPVAADGRAHRAGGLLRRARAERREPARIPTSPSGCSPRSARSWRPRWPPAGTCSPREGQLLPGAAESLAAVAAAAGRRPVGAHRFQPAERGPQAPRLRPRPLRRPDRRRLRRVRRPTRRARCCASPASGPRRSTRWPSPSGPRSTSRTRPATWRPPTIGGARSLAVASGRASSAELRDAGADAGPPRPHRPHRPHRLHHRRPGLTGRRWSMAHRPPSMADDGPFTTFPARRKSVVDVTSTTLFGRRCHIDHVRGGPRSACVRGGLGHVARHPAGERCWFP